MTHEEFKAARQALGLTQDETATILGLDLRSVQRFETAPGAPTARKVNPTAARVMRWMLAGYRPPEFPAR